MLPAPLRLYFENPAGRVFEQPAGRRDGYVVVEHGAGPRHFGEVQTLLGYAKRLLALRGWHKLLGDQRHMVPFTADEQHWVTALWLNTPHQGHRALLGAVVLPAPVYAGLPPSLAEGSARASAMTYRLFAALAPARAWLLAPG